MLSAMYLSRYMCFLYLRLAFDGDVLIYKTVQCLKCLANYQALWFSSSISTLSNTLVSRMKERCANNSGKYISVHLRFEEDIVAFSCCIYDGGDREKKDLDAARERGWKGKFTKPGRVIQPGAIKLNGKYLLTPLEEMLRSLPLMSLLQRVSIQNRNLTLDQGLDYVATWNAGILLSDDRNEAKSAQCQKKKPVFAKLCYYICS